MKLERRITFIIGQEGFAAWKLNRLKALSSYFRSVVMLSNISTGKSVNAENTLRVMSLGSKQNQLCQLLIEGSDAELACMVLTDFIADEFEIVNTSHRSFAEFSNTVIDNHAAFSLEFDILYRYEALPTGTQLNKNALMIKLAQQASGEEFEEVIDALHKRELVSSTCIGNGIALPHVMQPGIKKPVLSVLRLSSPADWHSPRGEVSLVIGVLIPAPPTMPVIKAFTQLSRALLNEEYCNLLITSHESEALKAILLHTMSKQYSALS